VRVVHCGTNRTSFIPFWRMHTNLVQVILCANPHQGLVEVTEVFNLRQETVVIITIAHVKGHYAPIFYFWKNASKSSMVSNGVPTFGKCMHGICCIQAYRSCMALLFLPLIALLGTVQVRGDLLRIIARVLSWMGLAAGQLVVLLQCICSASIVTWVQTNPWQT
jgi:hypothetical protein